MCNCGRLHDADLDRMAGELADHIIETSVLTAAGLAFEKAVIDAVTKRKRPSRRYVNFSEYYAFLAPHEAHLKRGLTKVWAEQKRTILSNLRKMPKAAMARVTKGPAFSDVFSQLMFAKGPADKALQAVYREMAQRLMVASAAREAGLYNLSTNWDVFNPHIEGWLKTHSIDLADEINTTTLDKLKASLYEGWEAGESIPDLSNRVRDLYEEFDKSRADSIARTESIMASGQGALAEYEASGVVDRVMWVATPDERLCPICEGLDGSVADLGEAFSFEDDYGDGTSPPAHTNCRCCIIPILEGETVSGDGADATID